MSIYWIPITLAPAQIVMGRIMIEQIMGAVLCSIMATARESSSVLDIVEHDRLCAHQALNIHSIWILSIYTHVITIVNHRHSPHRRWKNLE